MKTPKNPHPEFCYVCQDPFTEQNPAVGKDKNWRICSRCSQQKSMSECFLVLLQRFEENA